MLFTLSLARRPRQTFSADNSGRSRLFRLRRARCRLDDSFAYEKRTKRLEGPHLSISLESNKRQLLSFVSTRAIILISYAELCRSGSYGLWFYAMWRRNSSCRQWSEVGESSSWRHMMWVNCLIYRLVFISLRCTGFCDTSALRFIYWGRNTT